MTQLDSTKVLLHLTDKNIEINTIYPLQEHSCKTNIVEATLSYTPPRCHNCGMLKMIKYGFKLVSYKLPSFNRVPLRLKLRKQRFFCTNCLSTTLAKSPDLIFNHSFTLSTINQVVLLAQDSLTIKEISNLLGLSCSTIHRILYHSVHYKHKPFRTLPTNLCFDEFRSTNGLMSFICCDGDTHHLVSLLHNRLSKDIVSYFERNYSLTQRQRVQTVTLDLNASYMTFIKRIFPNAQIIVDRFHIIQLVSRALDSVRTKLLKTLDKHSREYRALKTNWRLYHKDENELNNNSKKYHFGLNEFQTQQAVVDLGIDINPQFKAAYTTYQEILHAVRSKDIQLIQQTLKTYKAHGTEMDTAINTLRKYRAYVCNSLKYNYSNGPIEGLNRKIKTLKRNCYGFRRQENFFIRIQLILA